MIERSSFNGLSENVFYVADEERVFFAPMIPEEIREAELLIGCVLENEKRRSIPAAFWP